MKIRVCLDYERFKNKERAKRNRIKINDRIAGFETKIEIKELVYRVGGNGHTYTPAVFYNETRSQSNFKAMQLFCLDFDRGKITWQEVIERCERFKVPVVFVYETLGSHEKLFKFRIGMLHEISIENSDIALFILRIMKSIFPEADPNCIDISRMFFGGKRVIYYNESQETFRVDELAWEYQKYSRENDYKHFSAKQKSIVSGIKLIGLCKNSFFSIDTYTNGSRCVGAFKETDSSEEVIKNWEKMHNANVYILEFCKKSQKVVFYPPLYQRDRCENKSQYMIKDLNADVIYKRCRLWRDFCDASYLTHNERFLLATNMIHIKGMVKLFLEIENHYYPESISEWKYQIDYIKARNYKPTTCSECPYSQNCIHDKNLVLTLTGRKSITRLDVNPEYVSVQEAYQEVYSKLEEFLETPTIEKTIYLIKAQTSVGKTEAYVQMIKNRDGGKPIMIAAPLIALKDEIYNRLPYGNKEQILSWEQINLPPHITVEIKAIYQQGFYKDAKKIIYDFVNIEGSDFLKHDCAKFFAMMEVLEKAEKHVVVTHAQLLNIPEKILEKYEIIIDEDILRTSLRSIGTIDTSDIQQLLNTGNIGGSRLYDFQKLLNDQSNGYYRCHFNDYKGYKFKNDMKKLGIEGDVNGFLNADAYHRIQDVNGDRISFCKMPKLPNQRVIILSATLDENIYRYFFKGREIITHEVSKVKYQGHLKQYTYHLMSRKNIKLLCEQYDMKIDEFYSFLKSICGQYEYGITFHEYEQLLGEKHLHFGNAVGVDKYKGKNGLIIGTHYLNEESYKMVGFLLGVDVKEHEMCRRRVEYNGYEFPINTYDNEILRNIHLYLLASEMEQCVGRSRLLRKNATVYLFSNFPCDQAEICLDDYMETKENQCTR